MTTEEYEELARLRRLAKRELAAVQRYHDVTRSTAAAFAVGDLSMITRVLNESGYTTSATALRAEPASAPTSYVTNPPWQRSPLRTLTPAQKRRRLEWLRAWHDEMHRLQWAEWETR
jgi:hypothetical protein